MKIENVNRELLRILSEEHLAAGVELAVSHRLAEITMAHPYASQAKASQKRRLGVGRESR